METSKRDWKLFREKLPAWQESFMDKLNKEYIELLSGTEGDPSSRFWALDERLKADRRLPGVWLELDKRNVPYDISHLISDGAITLDDITDFSPEMQEFVKLLQTRRFDEY